MNKRVQKLMSSQNKEKSHTRNAYNKEMREFDNLPF